MNSRCEFGDKCVDLGPSICFKSSVLLATVYVHWYGDAMRYEHSGLVLCTCSFFGTASMVSRMD